MKLPRWPIWSKWCWGWDLLQVHVASDSPGGHLGPFISLSLIKKKVMARGNRAMIFAGVSSEPIGVLIPSVGGPAHFSVTKRRHIEKSPWAHARLPYVSNNKGKTQQQLCVCVCVQSLSRVQLFATPWTAARQASLSFTISRSLLKFN